MNKRLSRSIILVLVLLLAGLPVFGEDLNLHNRSNAYLVGDYDTGVILEEYNADQPIEIASITKIMSYLVVADEIKLGNISLEDQVYIDQDIARVGGSSLKLKTGESLKVEDLLAGLMVVSGNDATYALAKHSFNTEEEFVDQMYKKAREIGLESAEFYNSTGLPEPSPTGNREDRKQNKMSPRDIFLLTRHIIKEHPEALDLSSMVNLNMPDRDYQSMNTNDLLVSMPGVDGFKTGYTDKAGYCLVSTMPNSMVTGDCRLIAVVMGTRSGIERSQVSRELLTYASENYQSKNLLDINKPVKILPMKNVEGGFIKVYPKENYREVIDARDNLDMKIEFKKFLKPSFKKDEVVGQAIIYKNEDEIGEVDLVVRDDIDRNGFFSKVLKKVSSIFIGSR